MKVLSLDQTRSALPFDRLIDALALGFCTETTSPLRHHHFMKTEGQPDDVILLMPAWRDQGWGGIKLVNVHPGNSAKGLPAISSTYVLFDRETGEHKLILDGGELTARRTAAASALAAKHLARADSKHLLLVGAGRVAANLPYAYRAALPIETVTVWSRTPASAQRLVDQLQQDGIKAQLATDLEAAVKQADIISCATLAQDAVIKGSWLRPGQHVDLIGSFTPQMREVDNEAIMRARVFIDTDHAKVESGDLKIPLDQGVITSDHILGTLHDLCRTPKFFQREREDITLFKGVGTAIEDLSAATLAMAMIEN